MGEGVGARATARANRKALGGSVVDEAKLSVAAAREGVDRPSDSREARTSAADIMERLVQPLAGNQQPSREELKALLDACLDLREHAGSRSAESVARSAGAILVKAALGWTEPAEPLNGESWEDCERNPPRWRQDLLVRLSRAPGVLPMRLSAVLERSIDELDDGTGRCPPLLRPGRRSGYGPDPLLAREYEELFWRWIYWRHGQRVSVGDACNQVAARTGLSKSGVDNWLKAWKKRASAVEVNRALDLCEHMGKQGSPFPFQGRTSGDVLEDIVTAWKRVSPRRSSSQPLP